MEVMMAVAKPGGLRCLVKILNMIAGGVFWSVDSKVHLENGPAPRDCSWIAYKLRVNFRHSGVFACNRQDRSLIGGVFKQATCCIFLWFSLPFALAEAPAADPSLKAVSPQLKEAIGKLNLPGVKINLDERSVDVDSRVCLREGLLELIACTKEGKVHESIISVEAKPSHIHAALLLLGATPGNPAMQKPLDAEYTRFMHLPPRGGPVDVFLVIKDAAGKMTETPISEFISPSDQFEDGIGDGGNPGDEADKENAFPTHTFLFTGSILHRDGEGPRQYLCDQSGHVISLSSFGDEMLALPGFHEQSNGSLMWQVNGDKLPEVDSKVILRLRPQIKPPAAPDAAEKPAPKK
jgi:hypothetical protein